MNYTQFICTLMSTFPIVVSQPIILNHPNNISVQVFDPVVFNCMAEGFGFVTIIWEKDGYKLPSTATIQTTKSNNKVTSTLKITKTAGYYSGQYYCIAKNEAGKTVSHHANLLVQGMICREHRL